MFKIKIKAKDTNTITSMYTKTIPIWRLEATKKSKINILIQYIYLFKKKLSTVRRRGQYIPVRLLFKESFQLYRSKMESNRFPKPIKKKKIEGYTCRMPSIKKFFFFNSLIRNDVQQSRIYKKVSTKESVQAHMI